MRFRWLLPAALLASALAFGAEQKDKAEDESRWTPWAWANFVILAGGLGYLAGRNAGPFFRSRSAKIRTDIAEATRLREEAEAKAREIEARLATLAAEIEKLRTEAHASFSAEGERIGRETERHLARIQQQTVQEIASMTKAASEELRAWAARLAVDLAEERIRSRMDGPAQSRLLDAFTRRLGTARPEERQ
jgi:F-type H+-transporting ATPase subunit b